MLPMITEVAEMVRAREIIDREIAHFRRHGHDVPQEIKVGAMVEVPALVLAAGGADGGVRFRLGRHQ